MDVENLPNVAQAYSITSMPTFVVFKQGEVQQKIKGADIRGVRNAINSIPLHVTAPDASQESKGANLRAKSEDIPSSRSTSKQDSNATFPPVGANPPIHPFAAAYARAIAEEYAKSD